MFVRKSVFHFIALCLVFVMLCSSGAEAADSVFMIGGTQPLSGANAEAGTQALNSVKLRIKQINANGGLNGQMLDITAFDDEADPANALASTTRLASDRNINALVGSIISGAVLASLGTIEQYKIPTYSGGLSGSLTKSGNPYFWRSLINQDFIAEDVVKCIIEMGFKSISFFATQDEASIAAAENVRKAVEAAGLKVLTWEEGNATDTSYAAQCDRIVASKPDCVYMSNVTPMQPVFIKELRSNGYTGLVFSRESYARNAIEIAGLEASYGVVFTWPTLTYEHIDDCEDPFVKEFLAAYVAEYGELPTNDCSYRGYNCMLILEEACRIAGKNEREAINEATGKIKGLQILGGVCDFTYGDHEPLRTGTRYVVLKGGKYQKLEDWVAAGSKF